MDILVSVIFVILIFLCAAAAGIYLVYLITGKDGYIVKTLIFMHIFSFVIILAATMIPFIMPDYKDSAGYIFRVALIIIVIAQSFWLYFKEAPFSFPATAGTVLLMNVVETIILGIAGMLLSGLLS